MSALGSNQVTTSDIYANNSLNMSQNQIINLQNGTQNSDAVNYFQSYRIGEVITSQVSTLAQLYYPYLLRCNGSTFNIQNYQTLYNRLGTNQLNYDYRAFSDFFLLYDGIPNNQGGFQNGINLSWANVIGNCDYVTVQMSNNFGNNGQSIHGSMEFPVEYIRTTSTTSLNVHGHSNINALDQYQAICTIPGNMNDAYFFFTSTLVSGVRVRLICNGLRNNLQRNFQFIIAL